MWKPYPTLWIGVGGGKDKILDLTAKYGEGVNFVWAIPVDELEQKFNKVDDLMIKHGREPKEMKKSYGAFTSIYRDEEEKEKHLKETAEHMKISVDELEKRQANIIHGTPEEVVSKIKAYKKIGVEHLIFMFPQNKEVEQMKFFKDKIMSKI